MQNRNSLAPGEMQGQGITYACLTGGLHNTLEVYRQLCGQHIMAIATNGLGRVQRSRLADFLPMTAALFISEEIGCDSLSSDIAGAKNAGMAACWYDRKGKGERSQAAADYRISRLRELLKIL